MNRAKSIRTKRSHGLLHNNECVGEKNLLLLYIEICQLHIIVTDDYLIYQQILS